MDTIQAKFFLYVRKSTDDGHRQVRSIADQLAEARDLASREGLTIIDTFVEKQTAKKPGRPVFNEMIERIEKGEASGIIAWHPDRLARNSLDGGRIIWLVDTGAIKDLKFPSYRFDPTPQGKLSLAIEFGISKYYVDKLSEDIGRGIFPAQAPIGYLNDSKTKTIILDPVKSPLIRRAFEIYATGNYTLRQVKDAVNGLGLIGRRNGRLWVANYQYILRNPVYYGLIRHHGEYFPGKHPTIISKALFDEVQRMMANRSKPKTNNLKPYLYRGVFHCGECGRLITTERQKGHNYLRCTKWEVKCSQPYVREDEIAKQISTKLKLYALPPEWAEWMIAEAEAEAASEKEVGGLVMTRLKDEVQEIQEQTDRLIAAYAAGDLSLQELRETKNTLTGKRRELEENLARLKRQGETAFEPLLSFLKAGKHAGFLAESDNEEERRDFLRKISSNRTISDRHLSVIPRGAWKLVVDQGSFAQHETAAPVPGAAFVGETHQDLQKRRR